MIKQSRKNKEVNVSFFAPESNIPITQEEIEKRKRRVARAEAIGSSITRVTTEPEHENPYRAQALAYIIEDKDIPDELLLKIKEYDLKYDQQHTEIAVSNK